MDRKIDIPDHPVGVFGIFFHHPVQECLFYLHEFFQLTKWPEKYLTVTKRLKNSKKCQILEDPPRLM
jgi:hypothetical protein